MYYRIEKFLEEKKASMIFLYAFFCFLLGIALLLKYAVLTGKDEIYYMYYFNPVIRNIYFLKTIFLSIIFFIFLYNTLYEFSLFKRKIPKKTEIILLLLSSIIICFVTWFEFYYGSSFDYGGNRDKQGLSSMLIGTSMFVSMAISQLFSYKIQKGSLILFIFGIFSVLIYILQYSIFNLFIDVWQMWSS